MKVTKDEIERAKSKDIKEFLSINGIPIMDKGRIAVCSSPFSSDSNPSFVVYTDQNVFHDFSTGAHGDTITLASKLLAMTFQEAVKMLNGDEMPIWEEKEYKERERKNKPFIIGNYMTRFKDEVAAIDSYARSRGITQNYLHGFYRIKANDTWYRRPSIVFPHHTNRTITGAKFRDIMPTHQFARFTARGKLGTYECSNILREGHNIYIVEGEANANSLCEYFIANQVNAVAVSFGGVSSVPKKLNYPSGNIYPYIIIDYDDDEELYKDRLKAYEHLDGIPIKLMLPKGEDINSLWVNGKHHFFANLL